MNSPRRAAYSLHLLHDLPFPRIAAERLAWWPFVRVFDQVLDRLERGAGLRSVSLRGSTLPLERYLMFRPEAYDLLEALATSGKVTLGPFFALPDYWLPNPEAHIRNLAIGTATARLFGATAMQTSANGYLLGGTGYPAQFPQILRGFGIQAAMIDRGLGDEPLELDWTGLDGSTIRVAYTPQRAILPEDADPDTLQAERDRLARVSATAHLPLWFDARTGAADAPIGLSEAAAGLPDAAMTSSLPEYLHRLRESRTLKVVRGELRSPERQAIRSGAASANLWIKKASQRAEAALLRHAEPLSAWAEATHASVKPQAGLRAAWQDVLAAQGALDGAVPERERPSLEARFAAAEAFAGTLADDSLAALARHIERPAGARMEVLVFNPSQVPRSDFLRLDDYDLNKAFAADVPPLGVKLVPVDTEPLTPLPPHPQDLTIENEFIRATVAPAGPTLTLTDKVRGITYYRLLQVVAEGDQGDVHSFSPVGRGIQNSRDLHHEGNASYRCKYYEWLNYSVRLMLDPAPEMQREPAPDRGPIQLVVYVMLRLTAGVPRLDVRATVENVLDNYRIRLHLPLPFNPERILCDGAFEISEFPIEDLPPLTPPDGWAEAPVGTRAVQTFAAVFDPAGARAGLVIANRGAPEVEALLDEDGHVEIALTALRAARFWTSLDCTTRAGEALDAPLGLLSPGGYDPAPEDAEPIGSMPGDFSAEFSLIPSDWENRLDGFEQAWAFADGPLRAAWPASAGYAEAPALPDGTSVVRVSDRRFRITAIKTPDDPARHGLIVRGFNLTAADYEVRFTPFRPFRFCDVIRLDESETGGRLAVEAGGSFRCIAPPHRILTFWLHD